MTEDADDTRGPAIVITGSVVRGFVFTGPFGSIEEAVRWCNANMALTVRGATVALLHPFTTTES